MDFCCEKMMAAAHGYNATLIWAPYWGYVLTLHKLTPTKKSVSKVGRRHEPIRYCPWCGAELPKGKGESTNEVHEQSA
jgi:hypothetical protein